MPTTSSKRRWWKPPVQPGRIVVGERRSNLRSARQPPPRASASPWAWRTAARNAGSTLTTSTVPNSRVMAVTSHTGEEPLSERRPASRRRAAPRRSRRRPSTGHHPTRPHRRGSPHRRRPHGDEPPWPRGADRCAGRPGPAVGAAATSSGRCSTSQRCDHTGRAAVEHPVGVAVLPAAHDLLEAAGTRPPRHAKQCRRGAALLRVIVPRSGTSNRARPP